jgi:hypothetical protein
MCQPLPIGDYMWVEDIEAAYLDALQLTNESTHGYLLEIDAVFPTEFHDRLNELPPMPVRRVIQPNEWSESHQRSLADQLNLQTSGVPKLICDLHEKKNYILHHCTLQMYVSLGVKITKINRVLRFRQSLFLKQFIDFNTSKRNEAKNKMNMLAEAFWKIFINSYVLANISFSSFDVRFSLHSTYGKMIEQVRDRQNIRIVIDEETSSRLTKKPTCQRIQIIDENCTLHFMRKTKAYLNRPILTGKRKGHHEFFCASHDFILHF